MEVNRSISKKELREIFPSLELLHDYLQDKMGFYLPYFKDIKKRDKAITADYLFDVLIGTAFSIKREVIRKPPRINKSYLSCQLQAKIEQIAPKKCCFPQGRLPSKEWLLEVLYSLNPKDELFLEENETEKAINKDIPESVYNSLKLLPRHKFKTSRTFRLTPVEREYVEDRIKGEKSKKVKLRVAALEGKKKNIEKFISSLKERNFREDDIKIKTVSPV